MFKAMFSPHHQEHLTIYGFWQYPPSRLVSWMSRKSSMTPAGSKFGEYYQKL
jgi:hypothetical protein